MATRTETAAAGRSGTDEKRPPDEGPVVVKKYANRRLYNTRTSSYVTLDHLARMVKDGIEFTVHDARTGEDITRQVLTQIIVEEEGKGQNLLPIGFLRQLISLYGDSLQGLVPQYLEMTMRAFADNQDRMRQYFNEAFGGLFPFGQFEEMTRRNMQLFEQTVNLFAPPGRQPGGARREQTAEPEHRDAALEDLKTQLSAMQRQIDALTGKKDE